MFFAEALRKLAKIIASYFMEEIEAIRRFLWNPSCTNNLPSYMRVWPYTLPSLSPVWMCGLCSSKGQAHPLLPIPSHLLLNVTPMNFSFSLQSLLYNQKKKPVIFSIKEKTRTKKHWPAFTPEFTDPFLCFSSLQNFLDDFSYAPCLQFFSFLFP